MHEEEEAKRKAVEYSRSRNCDALINYGNALIQTYQFKPGADALRKATELCVWEANAWGNLAIALEQLGICSRLNFFTTYTIEAQLVRNGAIATACVFRAVGVLGSACGILRAWCSGGGQRRGSGRNTRR